MDFLKAQWRPIVFGLVCLASLGAGGWAYLNGAGVEEKIEAADKLRNSVEQARRNPVNMRTIEQRQKDVTAANNEFERALDSALAMQKYNAFYEKAGPDGKPVSVERKPLTSKVLTTQPASPADAIEFRLAYIEAFGELAKRLKGRPAPTSAEIAEYTARREALQQGAGGSNNNPWGPRTIKAQGPSESSKKERPLTEVLRDYPKSRITEEIAHSIYMYVDQNALGIQGMAKLEDAPSEVEIWQAQMSLWIQQDIVVALSRCNEERAAELTKQGQKDRLWVAYMPVKRLIRLSIDKKLGKGGGSNLTSEGMAVSFTGIQNDDKMFVVPISVEIVVEEASLMHVLDSLCKVGFYTPIAVSYRTMRPNPLQEEYIYGDRPVVQVRIDLEAYYFRKVFESWIPKSLKEILKRPGARDDSTDR